MRKKITSAILAGLMFTTTTTAAKGISSSHLSEQNAIAKTIDSELVDSKDPDLLSRSQKQRRKIRRKIIRGVRRHRRRQIIRGVRRHRKRQIIRGVIKYRICVDRGGYWEDNRCYYYYD